jgi:eukaryotic-like serine/threonine-protein kinase
MNRLRVLIHEIHRRSLWQVLGIYLGGSWLMYQVITTLTQGIGLPGWVPGFSVVLFLIGLPIVVATAFVQEGHPLSMGRQQPSERTDADVPGGAVAGAPGSVPPGDGSPAASPRGAGLRRQLTWPRALLAGALAFTLLGAGTVGFMGLRAGGIGPGASLRGAGEIRDGDLLVLADFGSTTPDTLLGMVVTEALRVDLHQARVIALADPTRISEVLRRMARERGARLDEGLALEIVQRDGMRGVVAGEIAPFASGYALTSRIVGADGRVLAMFRETARSDDDLIAAVDRLSRKMRTKLGDSYRQLHATPPLERVTTSSFEALRRFTEAERMGGGLEAVELLEEAIALDPEFAMAYRKLRAYLNNMRARRGRALEASIAMYEHRDRLTEVERGLAEGDYHWAVTRDYGRAVQGYRATLRANPYQPSAHNNLPAALLLLRQADAAAEAAEAGLAAGTTYPSLRWNLAYIRFNQGDTLAARAVMDDLASTGHEYYPTRWPLLERASLGHLVQADSIAESLIARQRLVRDAREVRTAVALQRGRFADAERMVEEFAAFATPAGFPAEALLFRLQLADALAAQYAGSNHIAERVDAALAATPLEEMEPLERPYPELASLHARVGHAERARQWLARWEAVTPAEARARPPFTIEVARARIALNEGRPADALRHLRDADRNFEEPVTFLPDLGLTFEALALPDSAIAAYERFLGERALGRFDRDAVERPGVLLRLAALYEEQGDTENARAYYARYLELQSEPDPVLRPKVEEMRRRFAALTRG